MVSEGCNSTFKVLVLSKYSATTHLWFASMFSVQQGAWLSTEIIFSALGSFTLFPLLPCPLPQMASTAWVQEACDVNKAE